jgi:hypothetical protein
MKKKLYLILLAILVIGVAGGIATAQSQPQTFQDLLVKEIANRIDVDTLLGWGEERGVHTVKGGNFAAVTQDIIPSADNTYNVGSTGYRWSELHGVTAYFGGGTATTTITGNTLASGIISGYNVGKFYVDSSGNVNASGTVNILGAGTNYFAGKVGVGTTPTYSVDINTADGNAFQINRPGWGGTRITVASSNAITMTGNIEFTGGISIGYPTGAFFPTANDLYVSGNTGLGTSTPSEKLTVIGKGAFSNGVTTTTISGTSTSTFAYGATFATTAGNLGIATSSPLSRLTIVGANSLAENAFLVASSTDGSPLFRVKNSNGDVSMGNDGFLYEASSTIAYIGGLETGNINFPTDAGIIRAMDMDIVSSPAFTENSYDFAIGDQQLLKLGVFTDTAGVLSTTSSVVGILGYGSWSDSSGIYNGQGGEYFQKFELTTTNATPAILANIPMISPTSTLFIYCDLTAGGTTSSAIAAVYGIIGGVRRAIGGNAVLIETPSTAPFETNSDMDANLIVAGKEARIEVTGAPGNSLNWKGVCRMVNNAW